MNCDTKDFRFPMTAEIYYPIIDQSPYGNVLKSWTFDRVIVGNFVYAGAEEKEELTININITTDSILSARIKEDVRVSSFDENFAISNIVITNIRDRECNEIYKEFGGPRDGLSTLFEVATQRPFVGPFGKVEYYNLILKKSENQEFDV